MRENKPVDYYRQLMSSVEHHVFWHGDYRVVGDGGCRHHCRSYHHVDIDAWLLCVRNHNWVWHFNQHLWKGRVAVAVNACGNSLDSTSWIAVHSELKCFEIAPLEIKCFRHFTFTKMFSRVCSQLKITLRRLTLGSHTDLRLLMKILNKSRGFCGCLCFT